MAEIHFLGESNVSETSYLEEYAGWIPRWKEVIKAHNGKLWRYTKEGECHNITMKASNNLLVTIFTRPNGDPFLLITDTFFQDGEKMHIKRNIVYLNEVKEKEEDNANS